MRNSIIGMASHDLSNTKTTILGATPGVILGNHGNPHERSSLAPVFSERFFQELGWSPHARQLDAPEILLPDVGEQPDAILCRVNEFSFASGNYYLMLALRELMRSQVMQWHCPMFQERCALNDLLPGQI